MDDLAALLATGAQKLTWLSAERIAERGGFSYGELALFLGREPRTWQPRQVGC